MDVICLELPAIYRLNQISGRLGGMSIFAGMVRTKYRLLLLTGILLIPGMIPAQGGDGWIRPGKIWKDTEGRVINAHGGGVLYFDHVYYWFGEIKKGKTWRVPGISSWEDYRVDAGGVSCYASRDLVHWQFKGIALPSIRTDTASDLHISKVMERPKVVYNPKTRRFVMWLHIDHADYSYAHAGVAVASRPEGPYRYLGSFRPNDQMSRDMTVYQDPDGRAFLVYSSENNKTMQVCLLSGDYLKPTTVFRRILIGKNREAPAILKFGAKYYLVTSLCTGWDPNEALVAVADSLLGEWKLMGNPCLGAGSDSTYQGQVTYILAVAGRPGNFIFMADRWRKANLEDSRYVWLPLRIHEGRPEIVWKEAWRPGSSGGE
jgi:hypothetical protein